MLWCSTKCLSWLLSWWSLWYSLCLSILSLWRWDGERQAKLTPATLAPLHFSAPCLPQPCPTPRQTSLPSSHHQAIRTNFAAPFPNLPAPTSTLSSAHASCCFCCCAKLPLSDRSTSLSFLSVLLPRPFSNAE